MVDPLVTALEKRRTENGITADAMLKRAKVSSSAHWAWLNVDAEPRRSTVAKCEAALDALIAEKAAAS